MSLMSPLRPAAIAFSLVLTSAALHAQIGAGGGGAFPGQNGTPTTGAFGTGVSVHRTVEHNRHLQGAVRNDSGKAIPGAIVYLKNLGTGQVNSVNVNDDGMYRFGALDKNGDYQIWAQADKKKGPAKTISQYDTRDELTVNLKVD